MRKTKIICTIGPASQNPETIKEMIEAGMNVCRCNFSHGSYEEQKTKMMNVVRVSEEMGKPVATLIDTKGPEIRLRTFEEGKVTLEEGQKFILTTRDIPGSKDVVSVTYKNIVNDVVRGGSVLIDDGLIELTVEEITETDIICRVVNGGPVSDKKGVNLPGANLSMPFISEQDRSDILFGIECGFDFIALSFVRTKEDVLEVRKMLDEKKSPMKIIAKIENMQGIHNLDEILEVSDGIMVARGDMGVEVPLEDVPVIQKSIDVGIKHAQLQAGPLFQHRHQQGAAVKIKAIRRPLGHIEGGLGHQRLHLRKDRSGALHHAGYAGAGSTLRAAFQQHLGRIRHFNQAGISHFKNTDLIGGAKTVLGGPQKPVRGIGIAFKVQHAIYHVLQHFGAGNIAVLIDMSHHKNHDAHGFAQVHQRHGAILYLGNAAGSGFILLIVHRLDGVHDKNIRFLGVHGLQNVRKPGL